MNLVNLANLVGQTIDEKYKIERELGKGGMGAVYLATHIGTERPVAVKVIVPQFMQKAEFVERFKREARAAGRLRHPNVVDVTDFGFDETPQGRVAYLVMEYLDGCTLGEILEEEGKLPLEWSLDILEQVSSAVQTAHEQGIIHRDLKPDNIWLEPNQRGGYTVKVLDFGIAKLEENMRDEAVGALPRPPKQQTRENPQNTTVADANQTGTIADRNRNSTLFSEGGTIALTNAADNEAGTLIQPAAEIDLESGTAILPAADKETSGREDAGTRLMSAQMDTDKRALAKKSTAELTRVGAVLGTPLYMSPEQCRGEKLDARSDIYSLGVIAYQMLAGKTPFEGDFKTVMSAHTEQEPPPLVAKKIPRKVKNVIISALAKNRDERPPTADGFATRLRAQSEGIWALLRRSLVIYSEHLPKFLILTTFFSLPIIFITLLIVVVSFLGVSETITKTATSSLTASLGFVLSIISVFCSYLILGTTTWIVTQSLAVPLRPVSLRPALREARKKWKTFLGTGILSTIAPFVAIIPTCGLGYPVLSVLLILVAPVVMMENLRGIAALKRSGRLVRRSVWTVISALFIMFIIPALVSGFIAFFVWTTVVAIEVKTGNLPVASQKASEAAPVQDANQENPAANAAAEKKPGISFGMNGEPKIKIHDGSEQKSMASRLMDTVQSALIQILWMPMQIIVLSFTSIVFALLYLKTRQAGGEPMNDLLGQFESVERPQSNWQKRVRERLIQSGRITGKT
jgi:serine/threonine protein kinase